MALIQNTGILEPLPIPYEAKQFLIDTNTMSMLESDLIRSTELNRAIHDYVKANNLYMPDPTSETGFNRKVIIADIKLRTLFSQVFIPDIQHNDLRIKFSLPDFTLNFGSINVGLNYIYRRLREQIRIQQRNEIIKENMSQVRIQRRNKQIKEDLIEEFWKPSRVEKILEEGGWDLVDSY